MIPAVLSLPSLPLDERRDLPDTAGIYFVMAGDTVLYVDQSVNLRQRWVAHHRLAQLNEHGGCHIAWMQVNDARLLDELERACVAHLSPLLNQAQPRASCAAQEDSSRGGSLTASADVTSARRGGIAVGA
jgi:hypothetical protein